MCSLRNLSRRLKSAALTFTLAFTAAAQDAVPTAKADTKAEPKAPTIENSVVKIFSTMRLPDLYKPWAKQQPQEATGSGVIIDGKRILTNAHVVAYASQVQVQANQSGDKVAATVEAIAYGIDLAVLKLEDESFFDTRPPLARANTLPAVKDAVLTYGFPTGGTSLSITKGIVSRIEFTAYSFPVSGLRIQIDAAINSGNSGGPAVSGDKMIGLAFSHLNNAQNIGYIIPCEEIELFLKDVADGKYDGKPAMFDRLQTFANPALRPFLKVAKGVTGTLVTRTDTDLANYPLQTWDLITHIGDSSIDDEGMIKLGDNLRVRFQYLIQRIARDGKVPLTVIRAGQTLKVDLPVTPNRAMLIPSLGGGYPSFFVFGPLVFSKATMEFVNGYNNLSAALSIAASPLALRRFDRPAFAGEELVVVSSPLFPHALSKNYENPASWTVQRINGTTIKNLAHLVATLRELKDEYVVFEFGGRWTETFVFSRKEMMAATEDILSDNGVRSQGSADMLAVWNAQSGSK